MSTTKSFVGIGLGAILAFTVGGVQAASLTQLVRNNGQIVASDKVFDQWNILSNTAVGANVSAADLDKLDVLGVAGGLNPGPGLDFSYLNGLSVTGDGQYGAADFSFSFHVHVTDPTLGVEDASLGFLGWALGSTDKLNCTPSADPNSPCNDLGVFIGEWVYSDAALTNLIGGPMYVQRSILNGTDDALDQATDHSGFSPLSDVWVKKNIIVWSANRTDTATLGGFSQRFSQTTIDVPEPSSIFLVGAALGGLLWRRGRTSASVVART